MNPRYTLEIYPPDDDSVVLVAFSSDAPFMSINCRDLIEPRGWGDVGFDFKDQALEVVRVEHLLWASASGDAKHKVMVRTKLVSR
ncbi:MAG TPA: hypothetical protein VGJ96_04075 [Gemmatimonadaceae bacterium]|jgi:hypothetical protein